MARPTLAAMRKMMLILLLLVLVPRYVGAGVTHWLNCQPSDATISHHLPSHDAEPHHAMHGDNEHHGHHAQSDVSQSDNSSDSLCQHCDDCSDHCSAVLLQGNLNGHLSIRHDLQVASTPFDTPSRPELISRPPRLLLV